MDPVARTVPRSTGKVKCSVATLADKSVEIGERPFLAASEALRCRWCFRSERSRHGEENF
jgi:hypothetical protein